jgi:hypothetical protein
MSVNYKDFKFSFDITTADFTSRTVTGGIDSQAQLNNAWNLAQSFDPSTATTSPYYDVKKLPKGSSGFALNSFLNFVYLMQVSQGRFVDSDATAVFDSNNKSNVKSITISCKIINKNLDTPPKANDFLSATCIGNWYISILKYMATNPVTPDPKQMTYKPEFNSLNEPPLPGIPVVENPGILNILTFSPHVNELFISKIYEHNSNIGGGSVDPNQNTSVTYTFSSSLSIFDFIFQYSYLISFIGAVSISFLELIGIHPLGVLNSKILIFCNIIIMVASVVAFFAWFNTQVWFLDPRYINVQNVAKKNNIFK